MSIRAFEQQIFGDNPRAPIVKFDDDEGDTFDDQFTEQSNSIEQSFQSYSLEDLVQSLDNTINCCLADQDEIIQSNKQTLPDRSKTWSNLIEHLHTSLRHDLKLPKQFSRNEFEQQFNDFISIDDLNQDEETDLQEKLDMHTILYPTSPIQSYLTAEQVITEIDFMFKDRTPDSGVGCDDIHQTYLQFDLKLQTISSLNRLIDEFNHDIQHLSSILVQQLAKRDEFEEEKETKNTFIEFVVQIQNKRRSRMTNKSQSNTFLTTVIPYNCQHSNYLSTNYLQNLNKILHAINENNCHVPELLTNYILKVVCPC